MLNKLFGSKSFYKKILVLMIPIMIQNGITNFVNMLDNVMVGRIGTVEMTGVAVSNQLLFVFNLCIFGAVSGAGIFGAQFFGKKDHEGVRYAFRFKLIICIILCTVCIGGLLLFGDKLVSLYLQGDGQTENAALSLQYALDYLKIMLIGIIPFALVQCYSSTLRETDHSVLPMVGGVIAVLVNLALNYILIFGSFGAPKLGVVGAAVATVISRFAELFIVVVWTARHKSEHPFIVHAFRSLYVPLPLVKQIIIKGLPLMLSEACWSLGIATLNQSYSLRGLDVVAANNISQTFWNVFSVAFMSVGVSIGIILGQMLGAGEKKEVRLAATRMVTFAILISIVVASLYALLAEVIPLAYNTTDSVRQIATRIMQISALAMPLDACAVSCYFALRSGGKTLIAFLFDSAFIWIVCVPLASILIRFTALSFLAIFAIIQSTNLIKCIIGIPLINTNIWVKNIVNEA